MYRQSHRVGAMRWRRNKHTNRPTIGSPGEVMKFNPINKFIPRVLAALAAVVTLGSGPGVQAQWITQTNQLRAGWNAVYLHVDASHATLDQLVGSDLGNPIQEIWYWLPALPTGQFVESPQ